jgi:16S rRNA (cytosine967-C5)-methyltransferase
MKKSKPRDLALAILTQLFRQGSFLDDQLNQLFNVHTYLDERDRAFINQLVLGVLRWRLRLDWIIGQMAESSLKKMHPLVLNILRLACFQIFFLDKVPESAAVNEAVLQVKRKKLFHNASFVNGVLRKICRSQNQITFPDKIKDPVRFLSTYYSYPEWLVKKWVEDMGPAFCESLLAAGNRIPKTVIRVNSLRISRDDLILRLGQEGIIGKPTEYSPLGIELINFKGRVMELSAFKNGWCQVQDQAAQIVTYLLDPRPHEKILDICAGLGGKTTHLAQLIQDQGLVMALDLKWEKLQILVKNCQRLGLKSIHAVVGDATEDLDFLTPIEFDKILIDAPCSGLGVIDRHPDAKWNRSEEELKRFPELQKAILDAAQALLKRGGKMLYVTCTLNKAENEKVIEDFLESHKDFYGLDLKQKAPDWARGLVNAQGFLQTFPQVHGMNGFFAALLIRENV